MRRSLILATVLLATCAPEAPPAAEHPETRRAASDRARAIGQHMRAALACGLAVPATAQDRAATIESAALAWQQTKGGEAARDTWLHAIDPPAMTPRRQQGWCQAQRPDIERVVRWLDGAEGEAFAASAAAGQAR